MTPLRVVPTDVTDITGSGSTKQSQLADDVDHTKPTKGDPRIKGPLEILRSATKKRLGDSSTTMDKGNIGARNVERVDSNGAEKLRGVNTTTATPGNTTGTPRLTSTPTANMMTAPVQAVQTATPVISTAAQMIPTAANLGTSTVQTTTPTTSYYLTPQQIATLSQTGDQSTSTTTGNTTTGDTGVKTGNNKLDTLVSKVVSSKIPYAWGGGTLEGPSKGITDGGVADSYGDYNKVGFDCSGLTRYLAYQDSGVEIPRTSEEQYSASKPISGSPQPGDLVFPQSAGRPPGHVQMYIGDGKVVHAPQSGQDVQITTLAPDSEVRRAA